VKAKMAALDAKIAAYKQKHGDSLPELAQVNMQGLDQVEREMSRVEDQLRALKERASNLEQQLASVSPDTTNQERDSLRELRVRLIDLKSRYSGEYPDVIKTQARSRSLRRGWSPQGRGRSRPSRTIRPTSRWRRSWRGPGPRSNPSSGRSRVSGRRGTPTGSGSRRRLGWRRGTGGWWSTGTTCRRSSRI
jgi:hypothetical protein